VIRRGHLDRADLSTNGHGTGRDKPLDVYSGHLPGFLLMVVLVAAPQAPAVEGAALRGTVEAADGRPVVAAAVTLTCSGWTQSRTTAADGTFLFTDVPTGACRVRVLAPGSSGEGIEMPADTAASAAGFRVVLPASLLAAPVPAPVTVPAPTPRVEPVTGSLRLDLRHTTPTPAAAGPAGLALSSRWRSGATSEVGSPLQAPGVRPAWQDWSVTLTGRRPGPFGSLFVGSAGVRRTPGAVSLLSDATGIPWLGSTASSALVNPAKSPTIWDVRFRLERTFTLPGADITAFGEAYQSFEATPARDAAPPASTTKTPARTGRAVRGGASIRWE
jgi:hypothetical protein